MKKRHTFAAFALAMLCFGSGCGCHPVQRFRAAFPCAPCAAHRPLAHHRAVPLASPAVPLVGAPCDGCAPAPVHGTPVSYGHTMPGDLLPITGPIPGVPSFGPGYGVPTFGAPMPITPGPTVIPHSELPAPMPAPKSNQ
jgi:hypothetical protein